MTQQSPLGPLLPESDGLYAVIHSTNMYWSLTVCWAPPGPLEPVRKQQQFSDHWPCVVPVSPRSAGPPWSLPVLLGPCWVSSGLWLLLLPHSPSQPLDCCCVLSLGHDTTIHTTPWIPIIIPSTVYVNSVLVCLLPEKTRAPLLPIPHLNLLGHGVFLKLLLCACCHSLHPGLLPAPASWLICTRPDSPPLLQLIADPPHPAPSRMSSLPRKSHCGVTHLRSWVAASHL